MYYSNKYFGKALEEIINKKNIKLRSLAHKTNLDYSYFSKLKKRHSPPPQETIELISKGLGIKPEYFFEYRLEKLKSLLKDNPHLINKVFSYVQNLASKKEPKVAEDKNPFTNNKK
ncbi:MAG: helix-turn-helix transcriptional regulator [Candidatus Humimicrobiaceae bacterium]